MINGTESSIDKATASNQYWTIQGYTAYQLQLKRHSFRIQLGAQAEENTYRKLSGTAKELFVYDMESAHIAQGNRTFDDSIMIGLPQVSSDVLTIIGQNAILWK